MTGGTCFLGVDGGATRCRVRLRDGAGRWLGEAEGPPASIYFAFDAAIDVIAKAIAELLGQLGLGAADTRDWAAGLGLAGIGSAADEARVAARFRGFASIRVANDAVTACLGAHAGADGGVVIAGTGSAAFARVGGRETVIGGRGFIVGDDGSAARIGQEALRHALRAHDDIEPPTPLTRRLMARFGDDPFAVTQWALTARPGDFGALAPLAFEAADAGDPLARAILVGAGEAIAALASAVRRLGAERVALVGGLAEVIRPFLPDPALNRPILDPTDGAILLAGGTVAAESGQAAAADAR